jgi:hypothetical protein
MKAFLAIALFMSIFYGCGEDPVAGGSSDHGNARVAGIIVNQDGEPLSNAIVQMYPDNYNHLTDSLRVSPYATTTDKNGFYAFDSVKNGSYTISGNSEYEESGFARKSVIVDTSVLEDTITSCQFGSIYIEIDSLHLKKGDVLFFPGLKLYQLIENENKIFISQIPKGLIQLKSYDPVSGKTTDLGKEFLSIEIIPGRTLLLPSRSPTPFCIKNGSAANCTQGLPGEDFELSIIKPPLRIDGTWVYRISWGDGTISEWTSDKIITHAWTTEGIYPVQSQIVFQGNQYLAWSDPIFIEIIKTIK